MGYKNTDIRRLYVSNNTAWQAECQRRYFTNAILKVQEIPRGVMLPPDMWEQQTGEFRGGVCDEALNFVSGLQRGEPPVTGYYGVSKSYDVSEDNIKYYDEEVIFGGILIGHFGHFILECMGRMWYIMQGNSDLRIAFLVELAVYPWFFEFFDLLDIPRKRIILVQRPARFKSIIVPDEAVHSWYNYSKEYLLPYKYITQRVKERCGNKPSPKKIFLTRCRLMDTITNCVNEEYFVNYLSHKGYVAMALEELPLEEQIYMVSNADELAAILGSLTHWAVFCRPNTRFLMLTRTSTDTLRPQCLINEAVRIDWYIVDVAMNLLYARRDFGVCMIGPTLNWQRYIADTYGEIDVNDEWKKAYHEYLLTWSDYYLRQENISFGNVFDLMTVLRGMNEQLHINDKVCQLQRKHRNE